MKKIFTLMVALVATISCMAQTTTEYSGQLAITVDGTAFDPTDAIVYVIKDEDEKYTVELRNFSFGEVAIGNITVSNFTTTQNEDGSLSLTSNPEGNNKNIKLSGSLMAMMLGSLQGNVTAKIDGSTFTLDLPLNIAMMGQTVEVHFEGTSTTTSINSISANDSKDAVIYNMAGQQVGKSAKGIIIKNGKKYINAQGK